MNGSGGGGVTLKSRVTQIIKLKLAVLGALSNKGSGGGEGGNGQVDGAIAGEDSNSNLTRQWKSVRKSIGDISITSSVQVSYWNTVQGSGKECIFAT